MGQGTPVLGIPVPRGNQLQERQLANRSEVNCTPRPRPRGRSHGPSPSPPPAPPYKAPVLGCCRASLGQEEEEEEVEEEEEEEEAEAEAGIESSMKQVVVEEPLDAEMRCCKPGCCCLPGCTACCPKCLRRCGGCGCHGCHGCGGCLKRSLCFVPRLLCYLPRKLLSCHHLKCLLIVVVVVVLLVVIIAGALLMWLHAARQRADAVTVEGLERGAVWPWLPAGGEEEAATFYVDGGAGSPATVLYDYKNLLIGYRSWLHQGCYVTRMDEDNIQGLDAVTAAFRQRQAEERPPVPLADRSLLSTAANVLCSVVPVYWA
ncbi:uncharacterized protein LOC112996691 [Dromaius novaehollandiae]|uniref:uncharacterized protein LOC112996691 n=1 Tax=Dromaius novaehollandiae TaxID=8790 RepID=UPI00311E40E6